MKMKVILVMLLVVVETVLAVAFGGRVVSAATGDIIWSGCVGTCNSGFAGGSANGWIRTIETSGCYSDECLKLDATWNGNRYGSGSTSITASTNNQYEITVVYWVKFNKNSRSLSSANIKGIRPYYGGGAYIYATMDAHFGYDHYESYHNALTLDPEAVVDSIHESGEYCSDNGDGTYNCPVRHEVRFTVDGKSGFPANTWRKVRLWLKMPTNQNSGDGEYKLWIDETLVFSAYNIDRDNDGTDYFTSLNFYPSSEAGEAFEHWIDEMVIYEGYMPPSSQSTCPDGTCDPGETCYSCPVDCVCTSPQICCGSQCTSPPSCPDCNDQDSCTIDSCTGQGTCTPTCQNTPLTSCIDNDNCCPSGCNPGNDNDCSECLVAGDCPDQSCQITACTNNVCVYQAIGCVNGDGCCPSGCTSTNDNDCPSQGGSGTEIWGDSQDSDHPGTIQDTYINSGYSNQNFATIANLNTYTWPVNAPANAIIIKWDLSAIPTSSTITSAVLQLYMDSMDHFDTTDDPYDISVHRITDVNPDISTTTWNTPWSTPGGQNNIASQEDTNSVSKVYGYKSWSVTTMVQNWVSSPRENRGMLLNSDSTASVDSNRFFSSSESTNQNQRPKLTITYSGSGTGAIHPADNNPQNGCILENELVAYIALWKQDSTTYPMRVMMRAVALWKSGAGC